MKTWSSVGRDTATDVVPTPSSANSRGTNASPEATWKVTAPSATVASMPKRSRSAAEATEPDDDDDIVPAVVARALAWTLITIFRAAFDGLLAGEDPERPAARLRPQAERAYDRLATGLGDYGVAGPAGDLAS